MAAGQIKDKWLRMIVIPFISITFPLLLHQSGDPRLLPGMLITLCTTILVWEGNRIFLLKLRKWLSWENYAAQHIIVQALVSMVYAILVLRLSFFVSEDLIFHVDYPEGMVRMSYLIVVIITLMMNTIYETLYFSYNWKANVIRAELLKRENLRSQFESLKHQVSPHFLFNSLNTLSALIEEDEKLAVRFVHELANVYRYVLESQDHRLVKLDEELKFLSAYLFLLKMRFGENLQVEEELNEADREMKVPPLTLQLLIENAVKHNIVSRDKPLKINITSSGGILLVENKLQRKKLLPESTRVGLNNIRERYKYFSKLPIEVYEDSLRFSVRLPLIP